MEPMELGAFSVYPFGVILAAAVLGGFCWSRKKAGGESMRRALMIFWLTAIPLGTILAHVGYCLSCLDMIEDYFWETVLDFPGGGYLLFGALTGAAIALGIACRAEKVSAAETADLLAGPFLLLAAACALGEGIIGGGYGWKIEDWFNPENSMSLFALEDPAFFSGFPFAVKDPFYGYANWAVFLPVAAAVLLGIWRMARLKETKAGGRAVFSLSWYAAIRIFYESLRQDDIPKWGFVRVNQILFAILLLLMLILCARKAGKTGRTGISAAMFVGGVLIAGLMEFALEKKIGFLEWMPMDLCYVCSAAGCWMLYRAVERLRRKGFA